METGILQKIGVKEGSRATLLDAPDTVLAIFAELVHVKKFRGDFDYIHLFVTDESGFIRRFPMAKKHLKPSGMLWVSWPKSGKLDTDLSIAKIIRLGYDFGLVESKVISIDETWSAIKFTFPKDGKTYANSFGTLPKS